MRALIIFIITTNLAYAYCLKKELNENPCRYPSGDQWCEEKFEQEKPYAYKRGCDYKIQSRIERTSKTENKFEKGTLDLSQGYDPNLFLDLKQMEQDGLKPSNFTNIIESEQILKLDHQWDEAVSYYDGFQLNVLNTLNQPTNLDPNIEINSQTVCGARANSGFFSIHKAKLLNLHDPTCPFVKSPMISPSNKQVDYCNNFAIDYFYYLNQENVTLNYKDHEIQKKPWTIEGAMFALGWVPQESGWQLGYHHQFGNYWGIDGGSGKLFNFDTFENGLAFKLNHMRNGIQINGKTSKHPGWPDALDLLENKSTWTDDEMNKALRSGPYCRDGYPYNFNLVEGSDDICKNYSGSIRKTSKTVLRACLSVYQQADKYPLTQSSSVIYPNSSLANKIIRRNHVIKQMKKYAKEHYSDEFCTDQP